MIPSSHLLFPISISTLLPPLSGRPDQSSGLFATSSRSPAARGGTRAGGGVRRVCQSVRTVPSAKSVSGDMCDESDTRLDVLPAQGARLQL